MKSLNWFSIKTEGDEPVNNYCFGQVMPSLYWQYTLSFLEQKKIPSTTLPNAPKAHRANKLKELELFD